MLSIQEYEYLLAVVSETNIANVQQAKNKAHMMNRLVGVIEMMQSAEDKKADEPESEPEPEKAKAKK